MFQLLGKTHVGAVREHNEDAFYCSPDNDFAVVADGMGGYAAGEVASDIIVKTLAELDPKAPDLVASLVECHNRILQHAEAHPDSKGMGSAVVVARMGPHHVNVCWAGDSRAYVLRSDNTLKPVSRDHSYVQWLLTQGQITEEEARNHPNRNLVTQCLGIHPPQPEVVRVSWAKGDKLLLCSDGLTDELDDTAITELLNGAGSLPQAVDELVEAALKAGGKDNITVVVAENLSDPAEQSQTTAPVPALSSKGRAWLPVIVGIGAAVLAVVGLVVYQVITR